MVIKVQKIQKGDAGYIQKRKKRAWIMSFVILLIALAIFGVGLLMNDMSKTNIFTVFAILCVLPWAKQVVALVVVFPYHSVTAGRYEKARKAVPEYMTLYSDLVITSPDKIMHLDLAAVGSGQVIALIGDKKMPFAGEQKQDIGYIRQYLTKGVNSWGDGYKVKVVESEKLFLQEIAAVKPREEDEEELQKVRSYLLSLIV